MQRRTALGALASALLAACGGGGGGGGGGGEAAGTGALASFSVSSDIAAWGDSHTAGLPGRQDVPGTAVMLQQMAGRSVYLGGAAGLTSTQLANLKVPDNAHDGWINIFWYGGNNPTDTGTVLADVARSVASLDGNPRYLVLGVTNQAVPWQLRGTSDYNAIVNLNAQLAAAYGARFFDVRSWLIAQAGVSAQDRADVADDVVPSSLRVDAVHLNAAGSAAVARRVLEMVTAFGW